MERQLSTRLVGIRKCFAGVVNGPYFDVSARSLLYSGARAALDRYLDQNETGTLDKTEMFAAVERTRVLFAQLIGAEPDEIAFTRNVTDGIATLAASLPWKPGDSVVVCEALEHPANIFPWHGVGRRNGITIKNVEPRDGHIPLDRILAQIDGSTRVVTVSEVSFAPGFRLPLADLGAECRRRGTLLVVDGAQSIGSVDTDVVALNIDALAASTQKALMGLYGLGFLYIRRSIAETLDPVLLSRFGVDLGDQHEASSGNSNDLRLAKGARRFDVGNYNYPAIMAAGASLELLLELGPKNVEAHVCGLARRFATAMHEAGLPVYGGVPTSNSPQAHIVTIGHSLGFDHDSAGTTVMADLYRFLSKGGVKLSIRRDLLRFSFHIYNNEDDIERTVDLARQWLRHR